MAPLDTTPHLLLIDSLNLVRRVYEASPLPDGVEKAEGAISSSTQSFRRALREHAPTHCLWAFDHGGPTWRHERFAEYKIKREPMPEPLQAELLIFRARLANQGWAMASYPGVEAEDTIASVALHARARGIKVTVLSTDKDLLCLLEYGVHVHDHFRRMALDEAYCLEKFGVPSEKVQDVLALWGDSTDGVPGVPGVGVKIAAKLIQQYGCVDAALDAAAEMAIPGKLGIRLREHADMARLSRLLVELRYDVMTSAGHQFTLDELELGAQ